VLEGLVHRIDGRLPQIVATGKCLVKLQYF
jgi:hypothetical protein